jgi:neurotransmitter:Na+ symporter, NSS family
MKKQREHWGSQIGFVMAAAGSAIGLGTLWLFPYTAGKNGGGLFVLLYFCLVLLIGVPLLIAELVIGRRSQKGAVCTFTTLHKSNSGWKLIGWLGVGASFLIMSYYSVIAGWGLNYILMSLNQFWEGRSAEEIHEVFNTLRSSGDITLFWHFIFTLLTTLVVYQGVRKGIEHWSRIMTSGLLVLLIALVTYSVTLDGFTDALHFIFYPDFARFKPSGALEALGLSLYTLSLAQGIMITYGSYMKTSDNIPKTAGIIGSMIILIGIMASTMIFTIIFTYSSDPHAAEHVGPGLVYQTLPVIFSHMHSGSLIISTAFFVMLVFAGLTSAVPLIEVITANFIDLYGWPRKRTVMFVAAATFIFGIPSALTGCRGIFANWEVIYGLNFFDTMVSLVGTWLLPIGGCLFSIFVGWVLDKKVVYEAFMAGTTYKCLFAPWRFLLRWVIPLATLLILLCKSNIIDIDMLFKIQ